MNLEPQYVSIRSINSAKIYLRAADCKLETSKVDMLVSTIKSPSDNANVLIHNASRIKFSNVNLKYTIPNINERNNQLTFFSSVTNTAFSVFIPIGFYDSTQDVMQAIIDGWNFFTGTSGLTFSFSAVNLRPDCYLLDSAGGDYYVDPECTAVKFGSSLYALPIDGFSNSKFVGTMSLFYTQFIDFVSNSLTKYQKLKNRTTGYDSNIIYRIYIDDPTLPHTIYSVNNDNVSFSYNPGDSINLIDMTLYDDNGQILYQPTSAANNNDTFDWVMELIIEA